MSYGLARAGLVLLALGGIWVTGLAITRPVVRVELPAPPSIVRLGANRLVAPLDQGAIERAVHRPAFRADRRAPATHSNPERASITEIPAPPPAPKPALAVSGIVWGSEPAVVVEGVPGTEGSVVLRLGESAARLTVVRIQSDRVVIRGMDTTWQLKVREPWK